MTPKMIAAYMGASAVPMAYLGETPVLPTTLDGPPGYTASSAVTIYSGVGHAAFPGVAKLPNGRLVAACRFGVSHVGDAGVIQAATSDDNGATWTSLSTVISEPGVDLRDPALTALSDGRLVMTLFRYDYANGKPYFACASYSSDGGVTWTAPAEIPYGFTDWSSSTGPIVETPGGELVAVGSGTNLGSSTRYVRAVVSIDGGTSWGSPSALMRGVEPFAGLLSDGRIMVDVRSQSDSIRRRIFRETSGEWGLQRVVSSGVQGRPSWIEAPNGHVILVDRQSTGDQAMQFTATDGPTARTQEWTVFDPGVSQGVYAQLVQVDTRRVGVLYAHEGPGGGLRWTTLSLDPAAVGATDYATAVAADSPVAYWRMDEVSGASIIDSAGAHDGTLSGTPTLGDSSLLNSGAGGTAIAFHGTSDYLTVPHHTELNGSSEFTVEMWARVNSPAADDLYMFIDKTGASTANGQWSIYYDNRASQGSPQRVRTILGNAIMDWDTEDTAGEVSHGMHLVLSTDGTVGRLYVNGVHLVTSGSHSWTPNTRSVTNLLSSYYPDVTLDEIAIYQSALPADRILAHYRAGVEST